MAGPRLPATDGAPERLVEMSADVRAAVLADPAGGLLAAGGIDRSRARSMAGLAHELVGVADSSGDLTGEVEVQTGDGSVFVVRDADYILACVARRLALPALVLYDMRRILAGLRDPV